jgi:hypothetical protein
MSRTGSPRKAYRPETFAGPKYKPYALAIGQLALAWNALHEDLALLFIELLANGRAYPATDLWNSAAFDRPKRAMLRSLVKTGHSKHDEFLKLGPDLNWLLDQVDRVEDVRNDAIHSALVFYRDDDRSPQSTGLAGRVTPSVAFGNPRAAKLAKRDLLTEFRWCRDASVVLSAFAGSLYEAVAARGEWPNRPSLPNRAVGRRPGRPSPSKPA